MSDKTLLEAAEAIVELYTLHGECTFCGIGDLPQGQCSCPFGKLRATLADSADAEETADLQKLLARIDGYEAGADAPEGPWTAEPRGTGIDDDGAEYKSPWWGVTGEGGEGPECLTEQQAIAVRDALNHLDTQEESGV